MVAIRMELANAHKYHHLVFEFEAIKVPKVCMTSFAMTAYAAIKKPEYKIS